jgi:hypothetical protein
MASECLPNAIRARYREMLEPSKVKSTIFQVAAYYSILYSLCLPYIFFLHQGTTQKDGGVVFMNGLHYTKIGATGSEKRGGILSLNNYL